MAGSHVFTVIDGELAVSLAPALPGWLFDQQGEVSFTFLGHTKVTYHNPRHLDTFGQGGVLIQSLTLAYCDGTVSRISGALLRGAEAEALRRGDIAEIRAVLE
ncbi:hypothetical protein D3C73_1038660 [compost metagenome]